MTDDGMTGTMKGRILQAPRLSQALHKMAIEVYALYAGPEAARHPALAAAKEFVWRNPVDARQVVVRMPETLVRTHTLHKHFIRVEGGGVVVTLVLFGITFLVDLSPPEGQLARGVEVMRELNKFQDVGLLRRELPRQRMPRRHATRTALRPVGARRAVRSLEGLRAV